MKFLRGADEDIADQAARLDRFICAQMTLCEVGHAQHPTLLRIHPDDRMTLVLGIDMNAGAFTPPGQPELYRGLQVMIARDCVDGPVVECKSWYLHGRSEPWGAEFMENATVSPSINSVQTKELRESNERIWQGIKDILPEGERDRIRHEFLGLDE